MLMMGRVRKKTMMSISPLGEVTAVGWPDFSGFEESFFLKYYFCDFEGIQRKIIQISVILWKYFLKDYSNFCDFPFCIKSATRGAAGVSCIQSSCQSQLWKIFFTWRIINFEYILDQGPGVCWAILLLLPHIVPGGTTATTTTTAYLTLHHQVLRNGFQGGDQLIKACTCVRLHFPTRRPLRWDCPSVPAWDNKKEFCLIAVSWFLDWCCKTVIAIVQALRAGVSATIDCNRCQSLSLIASL